MCNNLKINIMFWKKKFEAIDTAIKDVCSDIQMVEKSVKSEIELDITELRLGVSSRLQFLDEKIDEEVNEAKTQELNGRKSLINDMSHIKQEVVKLMKELAESNEAIFTLTKQVNALIETHPNVAMYQGVFNRPEIIKKP